MLATLQSFRLGRDAYNRGTNSFQNQSNLNHSFFFGGN